MLKHICKLSDGIFLYAVLLVNDIRQDNIRINNANTFAKGFNSFYRQSMERKFQTQEAFSKIRKLLEVLSVANIIPEILRQKTCGYTQYGFLSGFDELGSWVNRYEEAGLYYLGFSQKSIRDWFSNNFQSGICCIDKKVGALRIAHFCKAYVDCHSSPVEKDSNNTILHEYIKTYVGIYYIAAEEYSELEQFMLSHCVETESLLDCVASIPSNLEPFEFVASLLALSFS